MAGKLHLPVRQGRRWRRSMLRGRPRTAGARSRPPTKSPPMHLQVVGVGRPFPSLQPVLEAQQDDGPPHRAMTLKFLTLSPARVPNLNEGLLLMRPYVEVAL